MKKLIATSLLLAFSTTLASDEALLDQDFRRLASDEIVNLGDEYKGKVLLIVNTASKCGNTPQYDGLEKLYDRYRDRLAANMGHDGLNVRFGDDEAEYVACAAALAQITAAVASAAEGAISSSIT